MSDVEGRTVAPEIGALATVGSRYLGPLVAQVAGSLPSIDAGGDVAGMMLGIGTV